MIFMEIFVSSRVRDDSTSRSFHFHWDKSSSDVSIPSFLCGLVGSSHILIPNFWHWFGFISDFHILFPNHKPCTNSSITIYPESSVNVVTPVHIGTFTCSVYSGRNGYKVHSSKVNDIGQKLTPKQWVSA